MADWFYVSGEKQVGPLDLDRLRQLFARGELKRDDLVWRDGMPNWAEAGSVAELRAPAQPAVPAPLPTAMSPFPTASFQPSPPAAMGYYSGRQMPRTGKSALGLSSMVIGIIAIVLELGCVSFATAQAMQRPARRVVTTRHGTTVYTSARKPIDAAMVAAGLGIIGGLLLSAVGVILGFCSLSRSANKTYGVLGTVFNGGVLLLIGGLFVIGIVARP
ncbi:MAG TPA: DUF4339 domain-containing protein [Tepidisphaeraceae bacterium]|jgi:hypothetical protein|nr:DUF4339 domain-containing protein [Tepidisphaeraceae bacterium]